jgi:ribosomal protein L15E
MTKERKQEVRSHARESGASLAEVLVTKHKKMELLTEIEIENYRRAYQVFRCERPTFLAACRKAIQFEKSWQFN